MHKWGGAVRAVLALALALSVAGCGGDKDDEAKPNGIQDMSANKALKEVDAAMRDWRDLWLSGTGGVRYDTGVRRVEMTMILAADGDCSVTFTSEAVGKLHFKLVGKTAYIQADAKALVVGFGTPTATARQVSGQWISQPATTALGRTCGSASTPLDAKGCSWGKEGKVGSTPSVVLKCHARGFPIAFHVATVGEPVLLRLSGTNPEGPIDLRVVDHDTGTDVDAPPQGDVIAVPR